MTFLNRYADTVYCLMRLIVGLLFACHGGQKILGYPPGGHGGPLEGLALVGAWIELGCGFMIAFGLLTRVAAFLASGEMAVAYFMVHAKMGTYPIQNHGEPAVFYCWVFLFIIFYGPGWLSIDSLIFRGRSSAAATTAM